MQLQQTCYFPHPGVYQQAPVSVVTATGRYVRCSGLPLSMYLYRPVPTVCVYQSISQAAMHCCFACPAYDITNGLLQVGFAGPPSPGALHVVDRFEACRVAPCGIRLYVVDVVA